MPLTFTDSPLYYKDSQGNYHRILSGADMTGYRTAAAQDVIDAGKEAAGLGLTGTSVGDLVRVNAVDSSGRPTSWKKVALNEIKCNKNLLDNWYFANPVNQRGQISYSNAGYTIDRWKLASNGQTLAIDSVKKCITITGTLRHYFSNPTVYSGITFTFSAIVKGTENSTVKLNVYSQELTKNYNHTFTLSGSKELITYTDTIGTLADDSKTLDAMSQNATSLDIYAVKLELGSEQTLAHNEGTEENPIWVLNEIPDYGEALRKCQRYFYRYKLGRIVTIANGYYQTETSFAFSGSLGVPLNGVANGSIRGNLYAGSIGHIGPNAMIVTNVGELIMLPNGQISGNAETAATTRGNAMVLQIRDSTTYIDFSCEP